jgi:hypothetical protein
MLEARNLREISQTFSGLVAQLITSFGAKLKIW